MSVDSLVAQFGKSMTHYENTQTVDAGGALVNTWIPDLDPIIVFLQPATPSESVRNGAMRMGTRTMGYCDINAGVSITDRLVYSPNTYEVTGIRTPDLRVSPDGMAYKILTLETIEGQK